MSMFGVQIVRAAIPINSGVKVVTLVRGLRGLEASPRLLPHSRMRVGAHLRQVPVPDRHI